MTSKIDVGEAQHMLKLLTMSSPPTANKNAPTGTSTPKNIPRPISIIALRVVYFAVLRDWRSWS